MKKGLSTIISVIVFVIFILGNQIFSSDSFSCSLDGEIDEYNAEIEITSAGDMIVSEKWSYNYNGDYSVKYRDIDFNKYNSKNPIYQASTDTATFKILNNNLIDSVKVKKDGEYLQTKLIQENREFDDNYAYIGKKGDRDERGDEILPEPNGDDKTTLFVYVPAYFTKMEFEYNYVIEGALTKYSDVASVNWNLFKYNEWDIKQGKVTISIPDNLLNDESLRCYARGAEKGGEITIEGNNQVVLTFDKIKKSAALEFRLLSDPTLYPDVDNKNIVNRSVLQDILNFEKKQADDDNRRIIIAQIFTYGTYVLIALMAFIIYTVYKKYDKEYTPNFNGKYYRELPSDLLPAEVDFLYHFGKINDESVTATLLDLVRRKYLIMENEGSTVNDKDPKFRFIIPDQADFSELKPHEAFLIKWFIGTIGDGKSVSIDEIEAYPKKVRNAEKFQNDGKEFTRLCTNLGKSHNYIEKSGLKAGALSYVLIPVVYLILCLFFSADNIELTFPIMVSILIIIVYFVYFSTIKRRTIEGNEEYAKWNAFKNFLLDFSHMEDYPMPGIIIWEHYLVYATVFKIADKVMEQLEVKLPEVSNQEVSNATFMSYGYRNRRFYYGTCFRRINSSYRTAKATGIQTIASYNASKVSSSGRGGGFSGGSSFGGGGGGGRSR